MAYHHWRVGGYDTATLAALLFVHESAVYNSLAELKGQLEDGEAECEGL